MRLLIISDSHGRRSVIENAIEAQPDAKDVIFLGDGEKQFKELSGIYSGIKFYSVCGNCDFGSESKTYDILKIAGKKILYTHGHIFGVKSGLSRLSEFARKTGVDVALFGHTHIPFIEYADGLYLFNPGSISRPAVGKPTYGTLDITGSGLFPNIINL